MEIVKLLHVLAVFIWIGNLLALTRLMGYHVKQEAETQKRLAAIYQRMVRFIGVPSMILAITCGVVLLGGLDLSHKPGWFHMKLTFLLGLIIADVCVMRQVSQLTESVQEGRGVRYKVLHGVVGLMLIGVLCSVYIVRDRKGEMLAELEKEQLWHFEAQERI